LRLQDCLRKLNNKPGIWQRGNKIELCTFCTIFQNFVYFFSLDSSVKTMVTLFDRSVSFVVPFTFFSWIQSQNHSPFLTTNLGVGNFRLYIGLTSITSFIYLLLLSINYLRCQSIFIYSDRPDVTENH
jgi:hypothetical protein